MFALSNRQATSFFFWPTDFVLAVPLGLSVLAAMAMAFLVGALLLWARAVGNGRRARRAEYKLRLVEAQLAELQARIAPTPLPPPDA